VGTRFAEEATNASRGWKIYRDRAQESTEDQLDGWNKTLDILLIFVREIITAAFFVLIS